MAMAEACVCNHGGRMEKAVGESGTAMPPNCKSACAGSLKRCVLQSTGGEKKQNV